MTIFNDLYDNTLDWKRSLAVNEKEMLVFLFFLKYLEVQIDSTIRFILYS
jgi:hypothetical protein